MVATSGAPERAVGKLERLGRERNRRDLALAYPLGVPDDPRRTEHPKGYWFDYEAADHAVHFIENYCRHHKGEWAGQPLILEPWQRDDIVRPLFGWRRPDGHRRYRVALVEIARKNGKSELGAAIGLYLTVADCEPGAEVYSSATKKDQARIVHDTAKEMVKKSPDLRRFVHVLRNNINCPELGSKFEPLAADSDSMDGLNAHGNIIDEIHAHKDRKVYDVLITSMGSRRQPLTLIITTSGTYNPESIGWQTHDHAVKVLEGSLQDDAFFAFIAAADPEDDWTDPTTWQKANPNLGVSVKLSYLAEQCESAKTQPSFLNTFLRLHLDIWTQQVSRWIPIERWNECDPSNLTHAEARERELTWAGRVAFGGLDLAATIDLAALALVFRAEDGFYEALWRFWCPKDTIVERSKKDRVPYDAWERDGWLIATPGNVIDYDFIERDIQQLSTIYPIKELGYDPWNATATATRLLGQGLTMVEVRQGPVSMSGAAKEFEKLVTAGKFRHGGHPIVRWMMSNVSIRKDANDNIMPDKKSSGEKIDGIVATVIAMTRSIVNPTPESMYEREGIFVV